jgi:hypothetical protein
VAVQPSAIRVSCYVRPGDGILAVISNLGRSAQTATINFDWSALQMNAGGMVARDAMSDHPLALDGGRMSLELKPESCRLLLLSKRR